VVAGRNVRLGVEPGRALVARAGALVAKVLYRKHRSAGRMLVVDTGMHHLLRPALYQAVHRVRPLRAAPLAGPTEVVGPICESTDVLATEADLPDLAPGDLVAFLDAGAYGMTMASNYNGQPRPAEIVVAARPGRSCWPPRPGPARRWPPSRESPARSAGSTAAHPDRPVEAVDYHGPGTGLVVVSRHGRRPAR
jgi:hypothetical protein